MENNIPTEQSSGLQDNSSAIFGTSSDAIVQGLHNGAFTETDDLSDQLNPDDSLKIVNEQEQNEIVNPVEDEFSEKVPEQPAVAATTKENQGIPDEEIEGEKVDDGIDNEEETLKGRS